MQNHDNGTPFYDSLIIVKSVLVYIWRLVLYSHIVRSPTHSSALSPVTGALKSAHAATLKCCMQISLWTLWTFHGSHRD